MNKITGMLREWGNFVADHIDYADEWGESILYRCSKMGGYVDQGQSSHKILCEDMPAHMRAVERAVKRLPGLEHKCVVTFFCAPLKEDGNAYTKRDLAQLLKISKDKYDQNLQNGKRRVALYLDV